MKKAIQLLFLSFLIVTFTSCSSDDNQSASNVVLLKKVESDVMANHSVYNFTYTGTKLKKVSYEWHTPTLFKGYDKYFYTGDLITEIKSYNSNNQITKRALFTYNASNQLAELLTLEPQNNVGRKKVFAYNVDGTVSTVTYKGTLESQTTLDSVTEKFFLENGNIVKIEFTGSSLVTSTEFEYDSANNPMRNVTGLDKIKLYTYISDGLYGITRNLTQVANTFVSGDNDQVDFELFYNQNNYPVASSSTETSPGPYSYQYEYFE